MQILVTTYRREVLYKRKHNVIVLVTLQPDDLNKTDIAILEELGEGRVTPQFVADRLDISRPYASEKLKRFVEHGHVEKLAAGLYELKNDPREE
jgi:DNA-binding MarR family transcriptional regulator